MLLVLLQQGSMGRPARKRVLGTKMLKLETTKGCIGVKQGNSLACHSLEKMGQDEREEVEGEASHASRTGNHLQFLSRGFPEEGAAMARAVPTLQGDKLCLPLASCREGKGADLGCRGANSGYDRRALAGRAVAASISAVRKATAPTAQLLGLDPTQHQFGHQNQDQVPGGAEGQGKTSAGRMGRADLPKPFILG